MPVTSFSLSAVLCLAAAAQQAPSNDQAVVSQTNVPTATAVQLGGSSLSATAALGTLIQGPLNVQTPITAAPAPGAAWNRLLGCAHAWGYYWVSGGAGTTGAFMIHQYTTAGAYIQSFTQDVSNSAVTIWGARDLAVDEASFKMWGGMENNQLKEYTFNPGAGPNGTLTFTASYTIPGGPGTVRALARNPANGHFYAKNFNSLLYEFTISPLALVTTLGSNTKLTYGLAWDPINNKLWEFDQNGPGVSFDVVEFNEVDPATGALTGQTFNGTYYGVAGSNLAGGCDIFDDGGGTLKILSLAQNTVDELNVHDLAVPTTAGPTTYCTAGTSTNGCSANLTGSANPSVTYANPCSFTATNVEGQKSGIIFYGVNNTGFTPTVWGLGSTSYLCVKGPTQRMSALNSGGTTALCDGILAQDWNAYHIAHPGAYGTPFLAGSNAFVQAWYRDPPAPKTTNLSNAVQVTFVP